MNREFKFRAWDKKEKRMITDTQDFIPLIVTNKGVMKLQPQFKNNLYEILPNDWFELMQYTGLKDRNGKDIYEGDILTTWGDGTNWSDCYHFIGEVTQKIDGTWIMTDGNNKLCLYSNNGSKTNFEVIGNIYEKSN